MRVVIIDDEILIRKGIAKIIEMSKTSYEIAGEAADGEEGFKLLLQLEPDIAIVDVKMPKMNGLEMIQKYRNQDKNGVHTHFIILSAYDDYSFTRQAIKLGLCDYLLKPVNRFELLEQLEEAARRSIQKKGLNVTDDEPQQREAREGSCDSINAAIEYIRRNFYQDLSLSCVAEQVHMHPNYLGSLFKKKTGSSFVAYLTSVRMEKAKQLLDNPGLKIYEICQIVGYYSPKHFSKVFKKYSNMTPNEYRDRAKHV